MFTWIIKYQMNNGCMGRRDKTENTGSESRVRAWFLSQYKNYRIISVRLIMKHYFLFYDSRNRLMAKRVWTMEDYRRCAMFLKDAAYVVEVSEKKYNKANC